MATIVKIVIDHIDDKSIVKDMYLVMGLIAEGGIFGFIKLRCLICNL